MKGRHLRNRFFNSRIKRRTKSSLQRRRVKVRRG